MYCHAGCNTRDILSAVGLTMADLNNGIKTKVTTWRTELEAKMGKLEAVYDYDQYMKLRFKGKKILYGVLKNDQFVKGIEGIPRTLVSIQVVRHVHEHLVDGVWRNTVEKKKVNKKYYQIDLNKIQKNKKILILLIAIIAIIIFCIYKVIVFVKNPTDTFTVQQGKIYQEERAIGYIIRDETIVKGSNYKNGMEQIKTEGERVAKGESIFRYYSSGEEKLTSKIKDLDAKIDEAISKETSLPLRDTKALEKQIENQIIELRKENNIQNISKTKKEISNNIVKKAKIAGEYSPAGSYLKKLIDERSKYENQLNEGAEYVKSPISGAVSYKVDGYEEVFTTDDFSKINAKFLEDLNLKTGQLVADSKESAKIINNFECYIGADQRYFPGGFNLSNT